MDVAMIEYMVDTLRQMPLSSLQYELIGAIWMETRDWGFVVGVPQVSCSLGEPDTDTRFHPLACWMEDVLGKFLARTKCCSREAEKTIYYDVC